jgi:hypothetical protein
MKGIINFFWNDTTNKEIDYKWKFSENGHLTILNEHKKGKSHEVHRRNTHMDHETSPLFDMKMSKIKPIDKI